MLMKMKIEGGYFDGFKRKRKESVYPQRDGELYLRNRVSVGRHPQLYPSGESVFHMASGRVLYSICAADFHGNPGGEKGAEHREGRGRE